MANVELTLRQRQVLNKLAQGKTYREVGRELGIGRKTVERHVVATKKKFGLPDGSEYGAAVLAAREAGLIN